MILHVAASIHAKPGCEGDLRKALEALVAPSRAEKGCLFYDLHTNNEDPAHFLFYEAWETAAAWHVHNDAPHIQKHRAANGHLVARADIYQLTKL